MNRIIISAPFGNYFSCRGVTSTIGTYTLHPTGFIQRFWRIVKTVRYSRRLQSWTNQLGLPDPGIKSVKTSTDKLLSIHGFNKQEWLQLVELAAKLRPLALELNLSCPNVSKVIIDEAVQAAVIARRRFGQNVIAKLAPIRWMEFVRPLKNVGINHFHLCNTIATPGGGISGKVLKQYSLWAVEDVRKAYKEVKIIGGGGITELNDVKDYMSAGADYVAVASMLFNPLNWRKLKKFRDYLEDKS